MKAIILELEADHPAKVYGFNYSVKVLWGDYYCGNGKFCKTIEEAVEYQQEIEYRNLKPQEVAYLKAFKEQESKQLFEVEIVI